MSAEETEKRAMDPKHIGGALAGVGLLLASASGYLYVSTPEGQKCAVELADAKARLELVGEAKDACKEALKDCAHMESEHAEESP